MKQLIALFSLLLSLNFNAQAASNFESDPFRFSYSGLEGRTTVHLACSYAERSFEHYLKKLGIEIDSRDYSCRGGFDPWRGGDWRMPFPISLNADIDATNLKPGEITLQSMRFEGNCFFDVRLIRALAKHLDLEILRGNSFCSDSRSRFTFKLKAK